MNELEFHLSDMASRRPHRGSDGDDDERHLAPDRPSTSGARPFSSQSFSLSKDLLTYFRDSRDFIRGDTDTLAFAEAQRYARENDLLQDIPEEAEEGEDGQPIELEDDILEGHESATLLRTQANKKLRMKKLRSRDSLHDSLLAAPPPSRLRRFFIVIYCTLHPKHPIRHRHRPLVKGLSDELQFATVWWQRWLLFTLYLVLSTLILVLVYYYNDFAASTELGKPVSVNCQMSWRNIPGLAKFHKTEEGWFPVRCQAYCSWTWWTPSDKIVTPAGSGYTLSSPVCKAGTLEGIFSVIHGGCALARTVKIPENGTAIFELAPCTQASHCTYFNYVPAITHVLLWAVVLPLSPHRAFVYALLCVHGFWYVVLAGQPQYTETFYQDSLASFLPYLAFCFVLYLLWIRHALFRTNQGLRYTLDTLLLYILPFFALLNMNYARPYLNFSLTSDGPEAIKNQPIYALVAILILFTAVFIMLCRQLWTARDEGQLLLVIGGYTVALVTFATITYIASLAGLVFHLHHYTLACFVFPITAYQTRTSAFLQACFLGVFVNGIAAYGFHSQWVVPAVKDPAAVW